MKIHLFSSKVSAITACLVVLIFSLWLVTGKGEDHRQDRTGGLSKAVPAQQAERTSQGDSQSVQKSSSSRPVFSSERYRALDKRTGSSNHVSVTKAISDVSEAIQSTLCHEADCQHLLDAKDSLELEYLSRKIFEARLHPRILEQSIEDIKNYKGSNGTSFRAYMMASDLRQYQKSVMGEEIHFPKIEEDDPLGVLVTDEVQFVFYDGFALTIGSRVNRKQEILSIREESMDVEDIETFEISTIEFRFPYLQMLVIGEEGFPSLFSRTPMLSWEGNKEGTRGHNHGRTRGHNH